MTEMELLKGLDFGHLRHRDRDNVGRHATANTGGSWSAQYRYKYTTSTWQTAALTLTLILGIEANWLQRNEALNKHKPPSSLETSVPEEVGLITRYRLIYKQPPSNQNHKREHESGEVRNLPECLSAFQAVSPRLCVVSKCAWELSLRYPETQVDTEPHYDPKDWFRQLLAIVSTCCWHLILSS